MMNVIILKVLSQPGPLHTELKNIWPNSLSSERFTIDFETRLAKTT